MDSLPQRGPLCRVRFRLNVPLDAVDTEDGHMSNIVWVSLKGFSPSTLGTC